MRSSISLSIVILSNIFLLCYAVDKILPDDPTPRQTCFDFTGRPLTNNTQCPGSNACCNFLHQCTDNLLCTQDDSDQYVNSLCAENPWKNCSNICQYGAGLRGFLPRVTKCRDGTFCCDSDAKCCEKGRGIKLDGKGNIVSSSTTVASSSPTTSSTASAATTTSSSSATPSSTSKSGSSLSTGAKAGIGVGAAVVVLSFVAGLALFLRKRSQSRKARDAKANSQSPFLPHELPSNNQIPAELPANTMKWELSGGH